MSIAVAVRKGPWVALAADTQSSFGSMQVGTANLMTQKFRKVGTSYLASTGWGLYENILDDFTATGKHPALTSRQSIYQFFLKLWKALHERYAFVNDQCQEKDSPFGDLDATFLVVNAEGIFYVGSDLSVTRFEQYFAIGSGGAYAMGALYALYETTDDVEALARRSVEAAMQFNLDCGGEIQSLKLKLRKQQSR